MRSVARCIAACTITITVELAAAHRKLDDRGGSGVAYVVGVGPDWGVDVAAGVLVTVGTGLAVRVAVAVASNVGEPVTVSVGMRVGTMATTVALVQSVTSFSTASCPAEHALFSHWPGSMTGRGDRQHEWRYGRGRRWRARSTSVSASSPSCSLSQRTRSPTRAISRMGS